MSKPTEKHMARLFSGRWTIVLFGLLALCVSSACLGLTPVSPARTPTSPAGTPTSPAGTPAPAGASPTSPANAPTSPAGTPTPVSTSLAVEGTVVFGPGSFNLIDPSVGLADLSSYTATLKLSFSGTQAGKAQQWSTTYVMLSSQQPTARQLIIMKSGDQSAPDPVFMAVAAGAAYQRNGSDACTAAVLDPAHSLIQKMEPAGFLTGVIGAQAAGSETVNGAAATHYTFDERALGQLGIASATGEMWVAATGGYLVKYVLTTKGDANTFGDGVVGILTADYELSSVNQPVTVQLPADCPAGMVTAPPLPNAANVENMPGLLVYDTATSLADATKFYQQQLPGLGWTQLEDTITTDNSISLDYSQGDQTMTVIITAGPAGTKVNVVLDRAQQ